MNCYADVIVSPFVLPRFRKEPASSSVHAALFILPSSLSLCCCQSSMPTSSSRVNTPSAWCPVAWEKTRQCISSWARPWCTPRRLSPSRDASLSSTTPTVCSLFHTYPPPHTSLSLFWDKIHFCRLILHPYPRSSSRPPLFFSLASFPPASFCHFVPSCPRFPSSSCYFIMAFHRTLSSCRFFAQSLSFLFMLSSFFLPPASPRRPSQGALHAF